MEKKCYIHVIKVYGKGKGKMEETKEVKETKNKDKKKLLLALVLLLILLIALVAGLWLWNANKVLPKHQNDPMLMNLTGYQERTYLPEADADGDGLTNAKEDELNTDKDAVDTDGDGISDYDEVNITLTDPTKADTDKDNIVDGTELVAGLDPLKAKTNDTNSDDKVVFHTTYELEQMTLEVSGDAYIYDIEVDTFSLPGISKTPGIIGKVYEFDTDHGFDTATLSIAYDSYELPEEVIEKLAICQYENDGNLKFVRTSQIDYENQVVTATLEHFSKYVLVNLDAINTDVTPQVMLLIDNSGSMYPVEDCEGSSESDLEFKRIDMVKNLVDKAGDKMIFGAAKFTGSYILLCELGTPNDTIKETVEAIKTQEEVFNGTAIETSLMNALGLFSKDDTEHRNFIVLLTDGESTEGKGLFSIKWYDTEDIINTAQEKNVTIITIGLGNDTDKEFLQEIATETEGIYIHASHANALDLAYEAIMQAINYNLADLDGDGVEESVLLADSGFIMSQNNFPYKNYFFMAPDGNVLGGQCYGIAALVQLYSTGQLSLTMEASGEVESGPIFSKMKFNADGYDLSNTFFAKEDGVTLSTQPLYEYYNSALEVYNTLLEVKAKDRYDFDGKTLVLKPEYKALVDGNPFVTVKVEQCEQEGTLNGKKYTAYEQPYIDISDVKEEELSQQELKEYEELRMIYRLYVTQCEEMGENFDSYAVDMKTNIQEENMDHLIELLSKGIPVMVTSGELLESSHVVNATRIYRDLENPNLYTLILFDSNHPDEEKKLLIERKKSNKFALNATAWMNDYLYTCTDVDGVFVSPGKEVKVTYTSLITEE